MLTDKQKDWLTQNFIWISMSIIFIGAFLLMLEYIFSVYMRSIGLFFIADGTIFYALEWYGVIR